MAGPAHGVTPSQTVGPFFHVGLRASGLDRVAPDAAAGTAILLEGRVLDGDGAPVSDALVEVWQADDAGRYPHPEDPRHAECEPAFRGFARAATHEDGRFEVTIVKPGPVAGASGGRQAPHVALTVFARGLLNRLVTRVYFPDEPDANAADEVLAAVDAGMRERLVARHGEGRLLFDVHLQGEHETPFFDV